MRYAEFRDRLQNALRGAGVFFHDVGAEKTIELTDTVRRWKGRILMTLPGPEPFHVAANLAFKWSPVLRRPRIHARKTFSRTFWAENSDIRRPSRGGRASI
jgi:hypothetical protein